MLVLAKSVTAPEQKQKETNIEKPVVKPKGVIATKPVEVIQKPVSVKPISDTSAKLFIYLRESGNNPWAVNPTSGACGLAQALPCSKMNCKLGDYACQDAWATSYMKSRYGTWENAKAFWLAHNWW